MGSIDRRKHDIDVMERVLGGAGDALGDIDPYCEIVDLRAQTWLAGTATPVQLTVCRIPDEQDPRLGGEQTDHDADTDQGTRNHQSSRDALRDRPARRD